MESSFAPLYPEWKRLYEGRRLSLRKIAGRYHVAHETVRKDLLEVGTLMRGQRGPRHRHFFEAWSQLYTEQEYSRARIAQIFGCKEITVTRGLKSIGVEIRPPKKKNGYDPKNFWRHVRKTDGCWLWTGSLGPKGFGRVNVAKTCTTAHRFSHMLHHNQDLGGHIVSHRCGNRACVNPDHLILKNGTGNVRPVMNHVPSRQPV